MKLKLLAIALLLGGCGKEEPLIRKEAVEEIAANMGKAERERFLRGGLPLAEMQVAHARKAVERAASPAEVALAAEDLRLANDELRKLEKEIEETYR